MKTARVCSTSGIRHSSLPDLPLILQLKRKFVNRRELAKGDGQVSKTLPSDHSQIKSFQQTCLLIFLKDQVNSTPRENNPSLSPLS